MRTTKYFDHSRGRRDRITIRPEWIRRVIAHPEAIEFQKDGRVRFWGWIAEADRYLRVVTLGDGQTVHNAFFDRGYGRTGR